MVYQSDGYDCCIAMQEIPFFYQGTHDGPNYAYML